MEQNLFIRILMLLAFGFGLLLILYSLLYAGYLITAICAIALCAIIALALVQAREVKSLIFRNLDKYTIIALALIVLFFVIFSTSFLRNTELIFFDEQIYQGMALNILAHGNAALCLYGTANLRNCYLSGLGFDPAGYPFILAVAFKIFGFGASTAYGIEILFGALSIIFVFLLASGLTERKDIGILSAVIFALIPEVFIWSKTPANPNMPFMLFTLMTAFFFVLFLKNTNKKTLALLLTSLVLTVYIRVEALLLIPVLLSAFFILGEDGIKKTFTRRLKLLKRAAPDRLLAILLLAFLLLIIPELYLIIATKPILSANATPFLASSSKLFALQYLINNIRINTLFLFGFDTVYPIIFLSNVTIFAIIGIAYLWTDKTARNGRAVLLFLMLFFLTYFIFYGLYFSGSVLLGGSVRFLLVTYPPLSILAAFGVLAMANYISSAFKKSKTPNKNGAATVHFVCALLIAVIFIVPFLYAMPFLRNPNYNYTDFPLQLNSTTENSIYTMSYTNRSLEFIYNNYKSVPNDCLVFSEAPYLWYTLNRSSAVLDLSNSSDSVNIKDYSCYVFDYGFWCSYPIGSTSCNSFLGKYKLKVLANEQNGNLPNFTLYQILNFTNST